MTATFVPVAGNDRDRLAAEAAGEETGRQVGPAVRPVAGDLPSSDPAVAASQPWLDGREAHETYRTSCDWTDDPHARSLEEADWSNEAALAEITLTLLMSDVFRHEA